MAAFIYILQWNWMGYFINSTWIVVEMVLRLSVSHLDQRQWSFKWTLTTADATFKEIANFVWHFAANQKDTQKQINQIIILEHGFSGFDVSNLWHISCDKVNDDMKFKMKQPFSNDTQRIEFQVQKLPF